MWKIFYAVSAAVLGFFLVTVTTGWNSFVASTPTTKKFDSTGGLRADEANVNLKKATLLLKQGEIDQVLNILKAYEDSLEYSSTAGKKWVNLYIDVSIASGNYSQLVKLYLKFSEPFWTNESASLNLSNALISLGYGNEYDFLRNSWKGREVHKQEWLFLDVDALLLNKQKDAAIKLLESQCFTGIEDCQRLVRLALLTVSDDPKAAWNYLGDALAKDPHNPDIHTYRARLLESVGKNSLALSEYTSAVNTSPSNIFLKDQLADFYLRHKQYPQALSVWLETLNGPSLDTIWLKLIFWSRMTTPIAVDWSSMTPPMGKSHAFNLYLLELEPGQFWNETIFEKLPKAQSYLLTQQATFWMRLVDHLKNGRENLALNLLQVNPFLKESWNYPLERALRQILTYRKTGTMPLDEFSEGPKPVNTKNDQEFAGNGFFASLDRMARAMNSDQKSAEDLAETSNEELMALLNSSEVFAAAFISEGWWEAGLQLHALAKYPEEFPEWLTVSLIEALSVNYSDEEAIKFALLQPLSPRSPEVVNASIELIKNNNSLLDRIYVLSRESSETGIKASWLLSLVYIDREQYLLASQVITAQPRLGDSVLGKETLARIALLQNNLSLANSLYLSIEKVSPEAKSYLASKAFIEKDWERAQSFTEALLEVYPGNDLLQDNLRKIVERMNGS